MSSISPRTIEPKARRYAVLSVVRALNGPCLYIGNPGLGFEGLWLLRACASLTPWLCVSELSWLHIDVWLVLRLTWVSLHKLDYRSIHKSGAGACMKAGWFLRLGWDFLRKGFDITTGPHGQISRVMRILSE